MTLKREKYSTHIRNWKIKTTLRPWFSFIRLLKIQKVNNTACCPHQESSPLPHGDTGLQTPQAGVWQHQTLRNAFTLSSIKPLCSNLSLRHACKRTNWSCLKLSLSALLEITRLETIHTMECYAHIKKKVASGQDGRIGKSCAHLLPPPPENYN